MPTYCFRTDDGESLELVMSVEELEARRLVNTAMSTHEEGDPYRLPGDVIGYRDYQAEWSGFKHTPGNWPQYSDAAGVAPHQVEEATRKSQEMGIPTNFTEDGRAIFEGAGHRKRYCESVGLFDRNAGYGDPTPQGRDE